MSDIYEVEEMNVFSYRAKQSAFLSFYNKCFLSLANIDQKRLLKKMVVSFFNILFDQEKRA